MEVNRRRGRRRWAVLRHSFNLPYMGEGADGEAAGDRPGTAGREIIKIVSAACLVRLMMLCPLAGGGGIEIYVSAAKVVNTVRYLYTFWLPLST